jgi:hypothetical protein
MTGTTQLDTSFSYDLNAKSVIPWLLNDNISTNITPKYMYSVTTYNVLLPA